jgi:hypothetical protein
MAKKNRRNDKTVKKDEQSEIKNAESTQKDKQQNKTVNIHYSAPGSSLRSDKNLIIVIICFVIIFSIVVLEKKFYNQNTKQNAKAVENIYQSDNVQISSDPAAQKNAELEKTTEIKVKTEKTQEPEQIKETLKTPKKNIIITNNENEEPMFTIEPLEEEEYAADADEPHSQSKDVSEKEMDEIILNFDADYKFNEPNKSYLTEKLNMAKKMGHSNNVVIYGYVNDAKNEESNIQKSLKMANDVAEYLKVSGYIPVSVQGKGSEDLENSEYVRKVQIQLFQYR